MRLAASLPTLPVGLACHGRSSEHVMKNKMSLLIGGEQATVVGEDDLKVRDDQSTPHGVLWRLKHTATHIPNNTLQNIYCLNGVWS